LKKQNNSLTIKWNKTNAEATLADKCSLLLPGSMLLAGWIGMVVQEWQLGVQGYLLLIPALLGLFFGLLMRWDKKWQAILMIGWLTLLVLVCLVYRQQLSGSLAGVLDQIGHWWLLRTGNYVAPYEHMGNRVPILLGGAVFSGLGVAGILRMRTLIWQYFMSLVVLIAWMCGYLESGWFLGAFLVGMLLCVAGHASGWGKTVFYAGTIGLTLAIVLVGTLWITSFTPRKSNTGNRLAKYLHSLHFEKTENPLPEGRLSELGAYRPGSEAAMEVTMEHWTPLYLRGFVAGTYTDAGWEALEPAALMEEADERFALQEKYFFGSTQIASGWQALEVEAENVIAIQMLGACRANAYLPYGVYDVTEGVLDSYDLRWEGMASPEKTVYTAKLYPVENSYLLQGELANKEDSFYRYGESVYRNWVYEQYVTLPENIYDTLTKYFSVHGEITTVQAKEKIQKLLGRMLTYEENIVTDTGERNFPSYVLEVSRQGYSVHYATLSTLLMRCCGIPARYVEGYVVTPSQAEALADGETLVLTQRNAHAWTEYYLDGVGWLPFDTTPGYEEMLKYELPPEGVPTEGSSVMMNPGQIQEEPPDPPVKTPQVEEEKVRQSRQIYIRQAICVLVFLLALAIVLLVFRTLFLRHQLHKRRELFLGRDRRRACAGILSYLQEMAETLGIQIHNLGAKEKAENMVSMLGKETDAKALETMLNEVWFSNHEITSEQQEAALSWLAEAEKIWKQRLPAAQRFKQRFIACKIL